MGSTCTYATPFCVYVQFRTCIIVTLTLCGREDEIFNKWPEIYLLIVHKALKHIVIIITLVFCYIGKIVLSILSSKLETNEYRLLKNKAKLKSKRSSEMTVSLLLLTYSKYVTQIILHHNSYDNIRISK